MSDDASEIQRLQAQLERERQTRKESDKAREQAELRAKEERQAREQAELRAKEERQAREQADKAKDAAELHAKGEQQARRDADLRAEGEQQARRDADLRAEGEQQARRDADLRAEGEQQARRDADLRAEEDRRRVQNLNFSEYLRTCHEHLHKPLRIETDKSLTSKGFTSPKNRYYYPRVLSPWKDFPRIQDDLFRTIHALYHPPEQPAPRFFDPAISIEILGRNHCHIRLANEASLRNYEKVALEEPAAKILNYLRQISHVEGSLGLMLGQHITFENDPNSLSNAAQEVQERLHTQPPRTPPPRSQASLLEPISSLPDQTRADQYCVYRDAEDKRELLFIVEYKPPHKLSAGALQRGFREMDLKSAVFDRATIPPPIPDSDGHETSDSSKLARETKRQRMTKPKREVEEAEREEAAIEERLQYNADKLVAAVATQTFHYMIESRLEYSYITTGESFVFLHIRAEDPTTLYYHVTVPADEADDDDLASSVSQTAIAQVACLCLMALKSERRSHTWCANAKNQLKKHLSDNYETILQQTPASERKLAARRKAPRNSPLYRGGQKGLIESKYHIRSWHGQGNPRKPPDDDEGGPNLPSSAGGGSERTSTNGSGQSGSQCSDRSQNQADGSGKGRERQYCTQKCLLGVTQGIPLDRDCPNSAFHPEINGKHTVTQSDFLELVQKQLAQDLDHNCEPLSLQGARGTLFAITLASHGYVFVGKGTVHAFVPDLLHEGKIYQQLEAIQGKAVPVCLGNIDLLEIYYLDLRVYILHMLLMSWGGTTTDNREDISGLKAEIRRTVSEVRHEGIDQGDVRPPNLLWNRETQRVMLIDFERACSTVKRPALQNASLNRRRKLESCTRKFKHKATT